MTATRGRGRFVLYAEEASDGSWSYFASDHSRVNPIRSEPDVLALVGRIYVDRRADDLDGITGVLADAHAAWGAT